MQKKTDQTFILIKSLKTKEISFFRKFAKLYSKNNKPDYLSIFELILKMKVYDENILVKKKFGKNLSYNKNYLFNQILKSLVFYHQEDNDEMVIKKLLSESKILHDKALNALALNKLNKAKIILGNNDKFFLEYEILDHEKRLIKFKNLQEKNDFLFNSFEQRKLSLKSELEIIAYQRLSLEVNNIQNEILLNDNKDSILFIKNLLKNNNLLYRKKNLTNKSNAFKKFIIATCYLIMGKNKKALKFQKKVFKLLESENSDNPAYIASLTSILNLTLNLKKYKDFSEYIKYYDNIDLVSKELEIRIFERISIFKLRYYIESDNLLEGIPYLKNFLLEFDNNKALINQRRKGEIVFSVAILYFKNENYKESSHFLDELENSKMNTFYKDILVVAKIMNAFCHLELGNKKYLDYYLKNISSFFEKNKLFFKFEKVIMKQLFKLSKTENKVQKLALYKETLLLLKPIEDSFEHNEIFEYFDFPKWLTYKTN